jgi:glycosyltransferase involved in cell wall biosynthesis
VIVVPCLPEAGLTPLFKSLQPDFLVSPLFGMAPFDRIEDYPGIPHVATIPDVALGLDRPEMFTSEEIEQRKRLQAQLPRATTVITLSEYSRQCMIRYAGLRPEKTVVVPVAANHMSENQSPVPDFDSGQAYVFYPANGWPNKRHALLFQVMKEIWKVRPQLKLVLAGRLAPGFVDALARHHDCPRERIIELGYISSDGQLATLYRDAEALLFVSAYESFGIPLLEAMENGCPVLCARATSMPEIAGDAAIYVDSSKPEDWANAFLNELPDRRAQLIERGHIQSKLFSWERTHAAWEAVILEAGLSLLPSGTAPKMPPALPLEAASRELNMWAHQYAIQQQALVDKETAIQNLAIANDSKDKAIRSLQNDLNAKNDAMQGQHHAMIEKENVIQAQHRAMIEKERLIQSQHLAMIEKEAIIQAQNLEMRARERAIRSLQEEMIAKEEVIQALIKVRRFSFRDFFKKISLW